jgi:hypothetical protein
MPSLKKKSPKPHIFHRHPRQRRDRSQWSDHKKCVGDTFNIFISRDRVSSGLESLPRALHYISIVIYGPFSLSLRPYLSHPHIDLFIAMASVRGDVVHYKAINHLLLLRGAFFMAINLT